MIGGVRAVRRTDEQFDPVDHAGNDVALAEEPRRATAHQPFDRFIASGRLLRGAERDVERHVVTIEIGNVEHEGLAGILMHEAELRNGPHARNGHRGGRAHCARRMVDRLVGHVAGIRVLPVIATALPRDAVPLGRELIAAPDARALLAAARDNLVATPKVRMLLDAGGVGLTIAAVRAHYGHGAPDILCIDPIRNLFDGGPDGGGENDNTAMLFFLQERVEALRDGVAPDAGLILCHHTRKITKKQLVEDPFMALSGAGSLRSFYTSGVIMHRPDEDRPERMLHFELRNGPGIEPMIVDKADGRWIAIDRSETRLVRREFGEKLDAERARKHDVILQLLFDEAEAGRLYTALQFAETFENEAGLGGKDTIRERISVLATKGFVKFVRDGAPFALPKSKSKFGYLCVEGMTFPTGEEAADPRTGEIMPVRIKVLPTTYKCPHSGAALPVENPDVWVYPEDTE